MKNIGLLVIISVLISACHKKDVKAKLNSSFDLRINQSAVIASEDLTIKLFDIADSRCPEGAECFWVGEASALLKVNDNEIQISTLYPTDTLGYVFSFTLNPYPKLGKEVKIKDYVMSLYITK